MGIKDFFETAVSYFGVTGNEEEYTEDYKSVTLDSSASQDMPSVQEVAPAPAAPTPSVQERVASTSRHQLRKPNEEGNLRVNTGPEAFVRSSSETNKANEGQVIINIKYPRKYDDAREIVDLFVKGECVIVDFQNMAENQALRCIDYLDGARSVEAGDLKKIASSMWLLTPKFVNVHVDDVNPEKNRREAYDFDLKRR